MSASENADKRFYRWRRFGIMQLAIVAVMLGLVFLLAYFMIP